MDICCFTDVTAPFVAAYDEILKGSLATFLQLTSQIGGDLSTMVSVQYHNLYRKYFDQLKFKQHFRKFVSIWLSKLIVCNFY